MKEVLSVPQLQLREKEVAIVDSVIGRRRKSSPHQTANVDWSNCALAQTYPDWEDFHIQLEEERVEARRADRDPHPTAAPPTSRPHKPAKEDTMPGYNGLPLGKINQRWGSKD
jgi:hypothetical protein